MFKHSIRMILGIAALSLIAWGPAALAENGPELPSAPAARVGFVPGPAEAVTPATPNHPHPVEDGVPFAGAVTGQVTFSDIALSRVPDAPGPPRAHIQGELFQSQGSGDVQAPAGAIDVPSGEVDLRQPDASNGFLKNTVTQNFDGLSSTGFIPPDTVMAPGPNHILEGVNSGAAIYSKTGASLVGYTTFESFFGTVLPSGWSGFMFDPRVLYSPEHSKFVMLILGLDSSNLKSYFFIGISQGSDPTGNWWLWRFDSNFSGQTADAWLDFAGLGADNWGVYVTGNYFLWSGGFKYSTVISLNPAMFTGGASNGWQFVNLQWPGSTNLAFSLQPALPLTVAGGAETFFVNSWSGFGSQLLLWTLTGNRTASPTLTRAAINVNPYSLIGETVDQPGSSTAIDGGDARVNNAFYSQRRVYTSLTTDPNADNSSSGAYLAKLNVDSNTAEWNTTLTAGAGWYYFYPAIVPGSITTTSPPVSVFLSWTHPAETKYASAAVRIYAAPPGDTSGTFPVLANGLGPYVALDGNGRNRWGDYSGAGYDFTAETMWGGVEYAGSGNTWRTRIAQVGTANTACVPDDNTLCLLDGRYAVTARYLRSGVLTPARAMTVLDLFGNPSQKTGGMAFEDRQTMAVAVAMRSACEGGFSFDWAAVGSLELGQWELEIRRVEDGATWTRSQPNNGNTSGIDQQAFPCI